MFLKKVRDVRVFALVLLCVLASNAKAEQLTVDLTAENYEIVNLPDSSQEIRMNNFGNTLTPGKPMLPSKTFLVAVPPGAEFNSINIVSLDKELLDGKYRIVPAPMMLPMDGDPVLSDEAVRIFRENKRVAYSTDSFYPQEAVIFDGEGNYRQFQFVRINFTPFAYNPVTQQLVYFKSASIRVEYTLTAAKQKYSPLKQNLADSPTGRNASILIYNYDEAKQWYQKYFEPNSSSSYYDYVIITTDALQNTVTSFVNWKQSVGYSVNVVTVTWINSNYSGSDLPQKIRNFLIDKYSECGIEYVLIIGDVSDIPMRMCSPKPDTTSEDTPTDYYYADLTGNWNSDGDSRYGEYGQDNVDWVPEVIVGRIPWSDASTVSMICNKLINFESNRGSWKKNALLLGAMINYTNEDNRGYAKTDGATLMEIHKVLIQNISGSYTTMYEKAGLDASAYSCTKSLTHNNVVNDWSDGQYGTINWWAHGSKTSAYRKWWRSDDGDGVPETSAGELSFDAMISAGDCGSLSNTYSPVIFACSCNNGWPESTNLGKEMIKRGSSGIVASSRLSWYSIGWCHQNHGGNASLDYYFFYYLINRDDKVGDALFNSKVYYSTHFMYSSWGYVGWQNMFDFNLYGDPSLYRPGLNPVAAHTLSGNVAYFSSGNPLSHSVVSISGDTSQSQTTGTSGTFSFNSLQDGASYTLSAEKTTPVTEPCILGYDAALAARIAVGLLPDVSDEQRIAADVDKNGAVLMYDASLIAKYAVGISPGSSCYIGDWKFNPNKRSYPALSCDESNQDFNAVILGDVDGNWSYSGNLAKAASTNMKYSYLKDTEAQPGKTVRIPIVAEKEQMIYSFDICLTFDVGALKFDRINKIDYGSNFEVYQNEVESGKLLVTGFSLKPLKEHGEYLEILFSVIGNYGKVSELKLDSYRINADEKLSASARIKVWASAETAVPVKFSLFQNYPNPFDPETLINYTIAKAGIVKLSVYNVLGQKVADLVNEHKTANTYKVTFDASDLTSGVYFYRLEVGDYSKTMKMMLLR